MPNVSISNSEFETTGDA